MPDRSIKRARARWLQDAPRYVADVFDNRGRTWDRYDVLFTETEGDQAQILSMSMWPTHPQGYSQWVHLDRWHTGGWRSRSARYRVAWTSLPEHIREHVIHRYQDSTS